MGGVFISYSRSDADVVRSIHEALAEAGREPWIDWRDIPPTAEWLKEVYAAIDAADDFLFMLSSAALDSPTCELELQHALDNNKRLIPVVVEDIQPEGVRDEVSALNWIFCRAGDDFESAVRVLFEAIDTDLDWVRSHTRLLVRAREWEHRGKDESFLLKGSDLKEALAWLTASGPRKQPAPSELHSQYVQASQDAEARELARVTRLYNQSLARQLAAQASNIELENPDLLERSVLLAIESIARFPTDEATQVLRDLIPLLPRRIAHWSVSPDPDVIEFSPDGGLVLTAAGRPSPLEAEHGKSMEDYVDMEDMERGLAYANSLEPDPRYGVAGLWDASTGREVASFTHESAVLEAMFTPDGGAVATLSSGQARLWDLASFEEIEGDAPERLQQGKDARRRDREDALEPHLTKVFGRYTRPQIDEELRRRGIRPRGKWRKSLAIRALIDDVLESEWIMSDAEHYIEEDSASSGTSRLSLHRIVGGREESRVTTGPGDPGVAVHPTRSCVATVVGGSVEVWEMSSEWTALDLPAAFRVERMLFSDDGTMLAIGEGWPEARIQVWDLRTGLPVDAGRRRKEMETALGEPETIVWDDEGHVCNGTRAEACWDDHDEAVRVTLDTGGKLELESTGTIEDVRFGPDDVVLLVRGFSGIRVWSLPDGELVGEFDLDENTALSSAALSADGTLVMAGDYGGRVGVWRLDGASKIAYFAHEDQVRDAVFSLDGTHLITASEDRTVRVWDLRRGTSVGRLPQDEAVEELRLSPDGCILATRTVTGEVSVWRWRPDDLASIAEERLTRNLSEEEWVQYLGEEPYPNEATACSMGKT